MMKEKKAATFLKNYEILNTNQLFSIKAQIAIQQNNKLNKYIQESQKRNTKDFSLIDKKELLLE